MIQTLIDRDMGAVRRLQAGVIRAPNAILELIESNRRRQEVLADMLKPSMAILDLIESTRRSQVWIAEMTKPLKAVSEMIESKRRFQERFVDIPKPLQAALDMIQADWQWQANVVELIKPPKAINDWIKSDQRFQAQLVRAIALPKRVLESIQTDQRWRTQEWWDAVPEPAVIFRDLHDSLEVSPSGEILIVGDSVDTESATAVVEELADSLAGAESPAEYFGRAADFFRCCWNDPAAKFVGLLLLQYYLNIYANLTTPVYQPWWDQLVGQSRQECSHTIHDSAQQPCDLAQLEGRRFVSAKVLQVTMGNGPDERIIGELRLGKVVQVIETEEKWTLVEYFDEVQHKIFRGWVASQYLSRFNE